MRLIEKMCVYYLLVSGLLDFKCCILCLPSKIQEDTTMTRTIQTTKVIRFSRRRGPAYPNAAERSYYLNKALDYAISLVGAAGAVSALLLLFVLL
jgi:hypothetical protein